MSTPERKRIEAAREHRERLLTKIVSLERSLAAPAVGRPAEWIERVRDEIRSVQQVFEDHIAVTEEDGGLFEDVLAAAPRLTHEVQALRNEHAEIAETIVLELEQLEDAAEDADTTEIRERLLGLLGQLARHRQRGSDLVWEAYELDIGALD